MLNRYSQSILLALGILFLNSSPMFGSSGDEGSKAQQAGGAYGKAPAARSNAKDHTPATATSAAVSSTPLREVIASNVTIAANDSAIFEWKVDLSGADKVGISVTTLGDANSRLTKVRIGVAFAAPGDWYILSDVILCSSFYYYDHGGVTVPVYGPFMKVAVFNDGSTPVQITQLAAYAVAR